jgi:hypothetical protein
MSKARASTLIGIFPGLAAERNYTSHNILEITNGAHERLPNAIASFGNVFHFSFQAKQVHRILIPLLSKYCKIKIFVCFAGYSKDVCNIFQKNHNYLKLKR